MKPAFDKTQNVESESSFLLNLNELIIHGLMNILVCGVFHSYIISNSIM